jgi:hypothetical protein
MEHDHAIRLDLNNPVFQDTLCALQKAERLAVLDALQKLRRFTWPQLYADKGLRWEKSAASSRPKASQPCIPCGSPAVAGQRPFATGPSSAS